MAKKYFTLIFIPQTLNKTPKLIKISELKASLILTSFIILILITFFFGKGYLTKIVDQTTLNYLKIENNALVQKFSKMEQNLLKLREELTRLVEFEGKIRIIADLNPVSPDKRKAGIGGSVGSNELDKFYSESSLQAKNLEYNMDQLLREIEFEKESLKEVLTVLEKRRDILNHLPSIQPISGIIYQDFGYRRDPFTGTTEMHNGVDIAAPYGTPIFAPADGIVSFAGAKGGYGLTIEIDHGYGYTTLFAHCSFINVIPGEKVKRGKAIGIVGSTGRTTGPHLHYEVHINKTPTNPLNYMLTNYGFD